MIEINYLIVLLEKNGRNKNGIRRDWSKLKWFLPKTKFAIVNNLIMCDEEFLEGSCILKYLDDEEIMYGASHYKVVKPIL